jgi:UDP-N-acetyl-D-galactosamine dehydrogenase
MCGIIGLFHTRATRTAAEQTIQNMIASGSNVKGARVNVLGLTFKEDYGDLRNSKVIDIIREIENCGVDTFVSDPQADREEAMQEYALGLIPYENLPRPDAIVVAVAHREFAKLAFEDLCKTPVPGAAFTDEKAAFDPGLLQAAERPAWRL